MKRGGADFPARKRAGTDTGKRALVPVLFSLYKGLFLAVRWESDGKSGIKKERFLGLPGKIVYFVNKPC